MLTLYGLFPVVFVYPYKPWASTGYLVRYVLFDDPNRWYWIIGIAVFAAAMLLRDKQKRSQSSTAG